MMSIHRHRQKRRTEELSDSSFKSSTAGFHSSFLCDCSETFLLFQYLTVRKAWIFSLILLLKPIDSGSATKQPHSGCENCKCMSIFNLQTVDLAHSKGLKSS